MAFRYTVRKLGTATNPERAVKSKTLAWWVIYRRVRKNPSPYRLRWNRKLRSPIKGGPWAVTWRVLNLLNGPNGPPEIEIISSDGTSWRVKRFEEAPPPVPNGPGTSAIDRIYQAVHLQFDKQWMVTNLGICAHKPGEHGYCNAWDIGVDPNRPAETIHYRIEVMAEYLREQGWQHDADSKKGLPVNGVIVMGQYWESGMGRYEWRPYHGTPHVSHCHVSGKPSVTGWI